MQGQNCERFDAYRHDSILLRVEFPKIGENPKNRDVPAIIEQIVRQPTETMPRPGTDQFQLAALIVICP